jgi:hypothetical protein
MKHLGGTTYGAAANTIARAEYIKRARAWAAEYFEQTYGKNWDELFSSHLPPDIEINTYKIHRQLWEGRKKKGSQLLTKIKSLISSP